MTAAGEFPWDNSQLVAASTAHRLQPGDRTILFCASRQQLYELNTTADAIWLALATEGSVEAAANALSPADGAEILTFVRQAAGSWLRAGLVVPAEVLELISSEPKCKTDIQIDELCLQVRFYGDVDPAAFLSVFGHFSARAPPSRSISAVGAGGLIFLFDGQQPLGAWGQHAWVPELKARITEWYTAAVSGAFLTHGALLSRDRKGLMICGEPGAGKTTLAVALTAAGFQFHSDDIVRIGENGLARGVAFCPAVKSGAWALLSEVAPGLSQSPVYVRSDRQEVRYLPVAPAVWEELPIAAVLLLARQAEGDASIEAVEPLDALTAILESSYSSRGAIAAGSLRSLVSALNTARTGRLSYASLDGAVGAVSTFLA